MNIKIRDYRVEDKEDCTTAFHTNVPLYFTIEEVGKFDEWLAQSADKPHTHFYVICSDNKVLGCGGFVFVPENNEIWLAWGLVHRQYHGQRFGKQLLQYRIKEIIAKYPGVPIKLDTTQYSFGFFKNYGFAVDAITENFYTPGLHRYDMSYRND